MSIDWKNQCDVLKQERDLLRRRIAELQIERDDYKNALNRVLPVPEFDVDEESLRQNTIKNLTLMDLLQEVRHSRRNNPL